MDLYLVALLAFFVLSADYVQEVNAHGMMVSPKSRNLHAFESGKLGSRYEATALNNNIYQTTFRSDSVCGQVQNGGPNGMNYDNYSSGVQAWYNVGQVITVDVDITVYHFGHFEFSLCPTGERGTPSQDCFRQNKLTVLTDNVHDAPLDPNYPERAMMPPESFGTSYSYQVALPQDLQGGDYVLKWMYVTANSCVPEGYNTYPFPSSWGPMYTNGLAVCDVYDLATPLSAPEIFISCAEVAISGDASMPGSASDPVSTSEQSPVSEPVLPTEVSTSNGDSAPFPPPLAPEMGSSSPAEPTQELQPVSPDKDGVYNFCGGGHVGNGVCLDGTCCSKWGYCDCTKDHCINGQVCGVVRPAINNCGEGQVGNGLCVDGTCCSEWGYCDCTAKHCGNGQTCSDAPTPSSIKTKAPSPRPTPSSGNTFVDDCCSNGRNGLIAANNCDGYVHCLDDENFGYQQCGPGLKFNQQHGGFCDYTDNVPCTESCTFSA